VPFLRPERGILSHITPWHRATIRVVPHLSRVKRGLNRLFLSALTPPEPPPPPGPLCALLSLYPIGVGLTPTLLLLLGLCEHRRSLRMRSSSAELLLIGFVRSPPL
jgi:hypothetical protein